MIGSFWSRLPWYLSNRYSLTIILFAFWMAFFDQHNMIDQLKLRAELYQLRKDKHYFELEIKQTREDLEELLADNNKLEKFAREKYFMKKANEEIFLFVEED